MNSTPNPSSKSGATAAGAAVGGGAGGGGASNSNPSKPKESPAGPSAAASPSRTPITHHPPEPSPATAGPSSQRPVPASIPPPPAYGFHNLDRRTVMLADGGVRSYFSLPLDYSFEPVVQRFESLMPYPPAGHPGFGPDRGLGLGFDRRGIGGRLSPENLHGPPRAMMPPHGRGGGDEREFWMMDGPRGGGGVPALNKRKFEEQGDELAWHRFNVLKYGNSNGMASGSGGDRGGYSGGDDSRLLKQPKIGGEGNEDVRPAHPSKARPENVADVVVDVDKQALKKAFLKFAKMINESLPHKINYLEDAKNGPLQCIACSGRIPRDFRNVHGLVNHAFNTKTADLRADHLGLHKALCVLLGWNYLKNPDNKANIILSGDEAQANKDDLIMWPPSVIIHNTSTGRRKDGRTEGIGNKEMDMKLQELGFFGGKARAVYCKEGHTGVTMVKFADNLDGLKEADRLVEYFEKDNRGRKGWALVQASHSGDDDKNPALVKIDEMTGEKSRIFYGYLATAFDLDKVDVDMKKKCIIKSKKELDISD